MAIQPEVLVREALRTGFEYIQKNQYLIDEVFVYASAEELKEIRDYFADEKGLKVHLGWASGRNQEIPSITVESGGDVENTQLDTLGDYLHTATSDTTEIDYAGVAFKSTVNILIFGKDVRHALVLTRMALALLIYYRNVFEESRWMNRVISSNRPATIDQSLLPERAASKMISITGDMYFPVGEPNELLEKTVNVIVTAVTIDTSA